MYQLLKYAGFIGVGEGILFAIGGIIVTSNGWNAEPYAPFIASIMIGSVIAFGGCLILALNEISRKKPGV